MIQKIVREPLVHFVLAAAAIVVAQRIYSSHHDRFRIVLTSQRVDQVAESYRLQFGVEPGPDLREALAQKDFEDEVLFREAIALGLDRNDEIIRRRLIQKMQFVTQDRSAPPEPAAGQLQAYFTAHREKYRISPAATFTHVYFSSDLEGDAGAKNRAAAVLARLNEASALRAPTAGDLFPDNYDFSAYEPQQVRRLFGQTDFSNAVFSAPLGYWSGPFQSGYGWHLLRVSDRKPATDPPFDEVKERVRTDYLQESQEAANQRALAEMEKQFTLIRNDRPATK